MGFREASEEKKQKTPNKTMSMEITGQGSRVKSWEEREEKEGKK